MAQAINREVFESLPVKKAVGSFVIPAMISTVITIIYSLADTVFVGMLGDPIQVAAMSVVFPIHQILNAFANLFGIGTNAVMARALGEKDYDRVSRASSLGLWSSVVFMTLICFLMSVFMPTVLRLAGGSDATIPYASGYLRWIFVFGGIPTVASVVMCNLLRAEGQAKKASFGLMLGGILNCVFDPIFIFAFKLEVVGAAMATAVCNCIALIYFLIIYGRLRSESLICLSPVKYAPSVKLLGTIALTGLPSFILPVLGATGNFIQNLLIASYSDIALAAFGITLKVAFIGINCVHGMSQGILPLVSYNFGAKNYSRVRAVNAYTIKLMVSILICILILCEAVPQMFMRIFIDDAETITYGCTMIRLYLISIPFMSIILMTSTLCQAVGRWQYSLLLLGCRQIFFNIPFMITLNKFVWPLYGVVMGQPCCDFLVLFLAILIYRKVFVKAIKE
ncbi:MAG: MATE family efflux transporter [Eubacteriales bacterium]|nr:MATE family efflux transporter [Eubacteriales bacterium]